MTSLRCSDWQIMADGTVKCVGQLTESAGLLPQITLAQANMLALAIGGLFATVWIIRQLGRVMSIK